MKPLLLILSALILSLIFSVPASAQPTPGPSAQTKITYTGGPGDKLETAVVISGAVNSMAGIAAEYSYLKKKFGLENVDWMLTRQSVLQHRGKVYDRMELDLKDGSKKTVFFDISEFFGKL